MSGRFHAMSLNSKAFTRTVNGAYSDGTGALLEERLAWRKTFLAYGLTFNVLTDKSFLEDGVWSTSNMLHSQRSAWLQAPSIPPKEQPDDLPANQFLLHEQPKS